LAFYLADLESRFKGKFSLIVGYREALARSYYGAADDFISGDFPGR
jgi:glycogen synthase